MSEAPDTDIEHLAPATDRELLVAIVACALEDETFGPDDVIEILAEHGRGDIRDAAIELNAVEGFLGEDDELPDDPEPDEGEDA